MELLRKFLTDELEIEDAVVFERFDLYNKLLLDWNEKINLISRNSYSIESHALNSIFFLTKYAIAENSFIADIGTGGGFPGIPLKILRNDLKIVLIDSIIKKTNAVKDIVGKTGLKNVEIITGRAETISKESKYRSQFDIATAKSVATLDRLYNWSKPFLKENGKMIFIKGGDITEELNLLEKREKNISINVIDFSFDPAYKIEDKKIVVINKII